MLHAPKTSDISEEVHLDATSHAFRASAHLVIDKVLPRPKAPPGRALWRRP